MDSSADAVAYQREVDEALMSSMSPEEEDAVQAELARLEAETLVRVWSDLQRRRAEHGYSAQGASTAQLTSSQRSQTFRKHNLCGYPMRRPRYHQRQKWRSKVGMNWSSAYHQRVLQNASRCLHRVHSCIMDGAQVSGTSTRDAYSVVDQHPAPTICHHRPPLRTTITKLTSCIHPIHNEPRSNPILPISNTSGDTSRDTDPVDAESVDRSGERQRSARGRAHGFGRRSCSPRL